MLTMLIPSHALNVACEHSLKDPRLAVAIARRVLACEHTDETTARGALGLINAIKIQFYGSAWGDHR